MDKSETDRKHLARDANAFYYTTVASNVALAVTLVFFVAALSMVIFYGMPPNELVRARYNVGTGAFPIINPHAGRTYATFGLFSLIPTVILKIAAFLTKRHFISDVHRSK